MSKDEVRRPKVEIVRACPGLGFSMLGDAINAVGRQDIFIDLPTRDSIKTARRPVLVVPAGGTWNFLPSGDAIGVVGMLRNARNSLGTLDGLTVAFDCAGEGFEFEPSVHAEFAAEMASHGLDRARCFLITSRTDGPQGYARWCHRHNQAPLFVPVYSPMQLYYYSGQYRVAHNLNELSRLITDRNPAFSGIRPRKYTCLNYIPREHRWAIILNLFQEKLMDQGFVSFHGRSCEPGDEADVDLDVLKQTLRSLRVSETLIGQVEQLDRMTPIKLDEPESNRFEKAYAIADNDFYAQSYINIVTESDHAGDDGLRFSEKILKPIANLQPFIALATPRLLAELRRLGFQTFSPYLDESYDEIEDPAERMRAAIDLAVKLIRMQPADLHTLYAELWPRLVHNYLHFLCGAPSLVDRDEALLALSVDALQN